MFGLFGKKKSLEEQLKEYQQKKDWFSLSKTYYDLGTAAMDQGDLNSAVLWLHRADTIYSAADEVFEKADEKHLFRKQITEDCSARIGTLEDAPLLHNDIPTEVDEKAEELNDPQLRVWGLFSIARLVLLGDRLGQLPGCEVLGQLGWAVDTMLKSFQEAITQEEFSKLMDICNDLYDLDGSEEFYAGGEIPVSGGAPFQVFDLNGMMGPLELNGYLDNHLQMLSALSQGQQPPDAESSVVGYTLLPDYYVRTGAGQLEDVPQVKAELARIWSDYDFVRSGITWEQVAKRVAEYKLLDILQV